MSSSAHTYMHLCIFIVTVQTGDNFTGEGALIVVHWVMEKLLDWCPVILITSHRYNVEETGVLCKMTNYLDCLTHSTRLICLN